ncbi:hypothetical protein, partial [Carboxylicivirga taeanensis]|uniref:hypothetical protein n=1 Tax=Carboxylicivirga taeanensis TaxID=1416875 RepID=UPI003F6E416C
FQAKFKGFTGWYQILLSSTYYSGCPICIAEVTVQTTIHKRFVQTPLETAFRSNRALGRVAENA